MLDQFEPENAVVAARHELGLQLLEDLRRIDEQMREIGTRDILLQKGDILSDT